MAGYGNGYPAGSIIVKQLRLIYNYFLGTQVPVIIIFDGTFFSTGNRPYALKLKNFNV
jgi:hypothetical protein